MEKDQSSKPKKKRDNLNIKIVFSLITLLLIFSIELYAMMNYSENYIVLGLLALLMIIAFYVFITSYLQKEYEKQIRTEEQYDSIFKSEKASYLLLRKNFDEISARLDQLEKNAALPSDNILNAQKAIAKVTINRSKENVDALLNSNDQMMEKVERFDAILSANNEEIIERQKQLISDSNQQYILKQQELLTSLKEMEASIKGDLLQTIVRTPVNVTIPQADTKIVTSTIVPQNVETSAAEAVSVENISEVDTSIEEDIPVAIEDIEEDTPITVEDSEVDTAIEVEESEANIAIEVEESETDTAIEVEEDPVEEEKPPMPDLSDPNKKMSADEIAAMFANADAIAPETSEPEAVEEPAVEETLVEEEKPPMPDLSDPNKKMSADEIAAMFANADAIAPEASEPEAVEEPAVEETPVEEEKPPMPDLSDPNKKMSADEIAAMFANADAIVPTETAPGAEEPAAEAAPAETAAPMPDLSDPNKMMSPEEIAALISNM